MKNLYRSRSFRFFALSLTVLIGLMIYTSGGRSNTTIIEQLAADIMTPFYHLGSVVSGWFGGITGGFAEKGELQAQIDALQSENTALKLENQSLLEYRYEANRLSKLLSFKEANLAYYDMTITRIVARSNKTWYKTVTVDKGETDGIKVNMPVINGDGLVGRVVSVSHYTSDILLLTDQQMAIGVLIQESRECNGIVQGMDENRTLGLINLPYYSKITVGQRVITSGLSDYYPKGLFIGKVSKINTSASGLTLNASVESAVDFDRLEELMIITAYRPRSDEEIFAQMEEDKASIDELNRQNNPPAATNDKPGESKPSDKPATSQPDDSGDKPSSNDDTNPSSNDTTKPPDNSENGGPVKPPPSNDDNGPSNNANPPSDSNEDSGSTINPGLNSPNG